MSDDKLTFMVDGEEISIETCTIISLRRNSESSTTITLDGGETIHVAEPFNSVYDRISGVDIS